MLRRLVLASLVVVGALAGCGDDATPVGAGGSSTTVAKEDSTTSTAPPSGTTAARSCDDPTAVTPTTHEVQIAVGCRVPAAGDPLEGSTIGIGTYGPLDAGMGYDVASATANRPVFVTAYAEWDPMSAACISFVLGDGEDKINGVGGSGKIASLWFDEPGVLTDRGIGVGTTRTEVQEAYPSARAGDNLYREDDDLYVDGSLPSGEKTVLRFVFEGDDRVTLIITGTAEHASLPEGCA